MISVFIDPGYQPPQILPALPAVKLNQPEPPFPLDHEIVNFMRNQSEPISAWALANGVAAALYPPNRKARRELKLQILGRITRLIHTRYLRRVGRDYLALR
jgi:hypothetical protein